MITICLVIKRCVWEWRHEKWEWSGDWSVISVWGLEFRGNLAPLGLRIYLDAGCINFSMRTRWSTDRYVSSINYHLAINCYKVMRIVSRKLLRFAHDKQQQLLTNESDDLIIISLQSSRKNCGRVSEIWACLVVIIFWWCAFRRDEPLIKLI